MSLNIVSNSLQILTGVVRKIPNQSLICKYLISNRMSDAGGAGQSFIRVILQLTAIHAFLLGDCIPKHISTCKFYRTSKSSCRTLLG